MNDIFKAIEQETETKKQEAMKAYDNKKAELDSLFTSDQDELTEALNQICRHGVSALVSSVLLVGFDWASLRPQEHKADIEERIAEDDLPDFYEALMVLRSKARDLLSVFYGTPSNLRLVDALLGNHGVQLLEIETEDETLCFEYCNSGDTYKATIVENGRGDYAVCDWGSIVEGYEALESYEQELSRLDSVLEYFDADDGQSIRSIKFGELVEGEGSIVVALCDNPDSPYNSGHDAVLTIDGRTILRLTGFKHGACISEDSDSAMHSIITFLTLGKGDTDSEYFTRHEYNHPAATWWLESSSSREALSLYASDDEPLPVEPLFALLEACVLADGTFGHEHCRQALADLLSDVEYDDDDETIPALIEELENEPSDDSSEEQEAIDILDKYCAEGLHIEFHDGDLICTAGQEGTLDLPFED